MKHLFYLFFLLTSCLCACSEKQHTIDLSGQWQFAMDTADVGIPDQWFTKKLNQTILLPGSMNTNNKGLDVTAHTSWTGSMWNKAWYTDSAYAKYRTDTDTKIVFWLQPNKYYAGAAWYQKKITIPTNWDDQDIQLYLERPHWETRLWVDDKEMGMQNALGVAHQYTLTDLKPGEYTLTLRVDNRIKEIDPGADAHSVSDNTQSNWNGIVGKIYLTAQAKIHIQHVKITPNIAQKTIQVAVEIVNNTATETSVDLSLQASLNNSSNKIPSKSEKVNAPKGVHIVNVTYPMGDQMHLWDEFSPSLYTLTSTLTSDKGTDSSIETFGMREVGTQGTQITINQRPVFLRGTLECAIFPKTAYPPTDKAEWQRIMQTCRSFGLNHIRFHSWCPPEVAFAVADSMGFYLQVECGVWNHNIGSGLPIDQFIMDESERIVRAYGNHPSFCLFTHGNEPGGPKHVEYLTGFVKHWKAKDRRFILTASAGWAAIPESDYLNLPAPRLQQWGQGIKSIINSTPPNTIYDWTDRLSKTQVTVSHEIGQWCVYPNLKERSLYTGVLKAKNFDIFEDRLKESGLLALADSFVLASGKLQVLCYKADIEAALRTPNFGGFQLLDLHDFPGQGTALVGVLDPFWNEKPYVTAAQYSQFCNNIVPLARINKLVMNSGDILKANIQLAQYGPVDLKDQVTEWKLTSQGELVMSGSFESKNLPTGQLLDIGTIAYPIQVSEATQYNLTVSIGTYINQWDVWAYPTAEASTNDIRIVKRLDATNIDFLEKGGKVLWIPEAGSLKNKGRDSVVVGFSSIFWNTLWTNNQAPHTLGILCDPQHPALAQFPTEYHSNYQWQDAMSHCQALPLHRLGNNIQPIVRIIDDWFTARSLGMIVELQVGAGRLLICSADIHDVTHRPAARQLKTSLVNYMKTDQFQPKQSTTREQIRSLMP